MPSPLRPDSDASPFVHPADRLDPIALSGADARKLAGEMFRRLVIQCLPAMKCPKRGPSRRYLNALGVRLAATVYVYSPELFMDMPLHTIARELGLSRVGLKWCIAKIRAEQAQLADGQPVIEKQEVKNPIIGIVKNHGSFLGHPASRGSARGRS